MLISKAYALAEEHGLTLGQLTDDLKITRARLRLLLGQPDTDPAPGLRISMNRLLILIAMGRRTSADAGNGGGLIWRSAPVTVLFIMTELLPM